MDLVWQLQDAKQRFSELIRATENGAQVVSRHGEAVAVVINIDEYHRLKSADDAVINFKDFLRTGPHFDDADLLRSQETSSSVEL